MEQNMVEAYTGEILEATEEWEEPIPFEEDTKTRPFPTDALPPPVRDMVRCLAESTQTPEEMAGLLSLGVLSTAFQSRYVMEVNSDWQEPLCLYCVAVAPPAERKSAVLSSLTAPILAYERQHREQEAPVIERNRTERAVLEAELQAAKGQAVGNGSGKQEARKRAMELSEQLARFETLREYRLLVDDSTPEKLIGMLEEQHGCLTVCSAEGGIFDSMRGRYEKALREAGGGGFAIDFCPPPVLSCF